MYAGPNLKHMLLLTTLKNSYKLYITTFNPVICRHPPPTASRRFTFPKHQRSSMPALLLWLSSLHFSLRKSPLLLALDFLSIHTTAAAASHWRTHSGISWTLYIGHNAMKLHWQLHSESCLPAWKCVNKLIGEEAVNCNHSIADYLHSSNTGTLPSGRFRSLLIPLQHQPRIFKWWNSKADNEYKN